MSLLILFLSTLSITERGVLKSLKIDLPISPCSFTSFAKYILMLCLLVHTPYGIIIFSWRISIFIARVNIDILWISELKWTGMGEFNSDDNYIYYCGQESLRRNGVAIMVNRRVRNAVLGCNLKNDRIISAHFQGKPFNIQVYAPTSNAEEAEVERFYKSHKTF